MDPRLSWASNVDAPRVPLDLVRMLIMMIVLLIMMTTMKKMVTRQGGSVCTQYGRGLPPRVVESPRPRHNDHDDSDDESDNDDDDESDNDDDIVSPHF